MSKWIKNILITLVVIWIGYFLIMGEVNQRKASTEFCKQQCNYSPETKTWAINLKWFFDENQVESQMETEKSFPEKEFDGCIKYCKDLEVEYKYLTQ